MCLKLNRYSDFGNDAPAHIFYFFLISISLKNFENFTKKNMGEVLTVGAYIVFNKITLFLGSLIPLIIIIFKKNIRLFDSKIIFFLMLFVFSFFIKNLLVSGCFAFPIEKTCLTKVFWYDLNSNRGSNAKMTMLENEAWTKGWSDQKKNRKNFEEYLSSLDWVTLWSKNHGKRALIKMIPFLFLLIVISLIIFRFASDEKNTNLQKNNLSYKKIFFAFLIINIIGSIMWFLKFPVFRYGYSYLVSSLAILTTIICWNKIQLIDILKLKKEIQYGNIYEVNYCQEFFAENVELDFPMDTYFKLNRITKAPFSTFLQTDNHVIFCGSPERYLKKKGKRLLSQPIKGTAPRGMDAQADEALKLHLQNDPKERAENIMIVDLVRNDLSRICATNGAAAFRALTRPSADSNLCFASSALMANSKSGTRFAIKSRSAKSPLC